MGGGGRGCVREGGREGGKNAHYGISLNLQGCRAGENIRFVQMCLNWEEKRRKTDECIRLIYLFASQSKGCRIREVMRNLRTEEGGREGGRREKSKVQSISKA